MCEIGERLPECETGSVERMLEAAIEWNRGIASDMVFDMAPHDVRLLRDRQDSQTKLLRNILAKMQRAENKAGACDEPCFEAIVHGDVTRCPVCSMPLRVAWHMEPTHG